MFYMYFSVFAPLNEIISGLTTEKQALWERLWMVSDKRIGRIHPMIYNHPATGKKVGDIIQVIHI